uniref:RNA-directed DNA polymerase n=1 Tax=Trichuris muris TaxID=70415 RepID=A0A5S6QBE1_TRIMR
MAKSTQTKAEMPLVPPTINVSLPRQFDSGDFLEWATRLELCSRSNGWSDAVMAMKLPTLLEGEAYRVYQSLHKEVLNTYSSLKEALNTRLLPAELLHSALQHFEERKLKPGETVEAFAYHLRRLLRLAMPSLDDASTENLLLHHFVRGLPSAHSRALRLCDDIKTLEDAVSKARLISDIDSEETNRSSPSAATTNALDNKLDQLTYAVQQLHLQLHARQQTNDSTPPYFQPSRGIPRQRYDDKRRCFSCGTVGHIARNCQRSRQPNRGQARANSNPRTDAQQDGNISFSSLITIGQNSLNCTAFGKIGDTDMEVLIDSGSSTSLISAKTFHQLNTAVKSRQVTAAYLVTASGQKVAIHHAVVLPLEMGQLRTQREFLVVDGLGLSLLLGMDFLCRYKAQIDFADMSMKGPLVGSVTLNTSSPRDAATSNRFKGYTTTAHVANTALVDKDDRILEACAMPQLLDNKVDLPECPALFYNLVKSNAKLFQEKPGRTSAAFHIISIGTSPPIRIPPRKVPVHLRQDVEQQIVKMVENGIIRRSSSPWLFPAVFIKKKTGELRICIDYRELNKLTRKDAYPLPLPDEVQDRIGGATVFSTLDLNSGFWQLPIHPNDCEKTAFSPGPGLGLYEFVCMPFGLTGGPSSFQRLMDRVLNGLKFAMVYLDDVLIFSRDQDEHHRHLAAVFRRLIENGLTLRGSKCHLAKSQIRYLGHVFSARGMEPEHSKVSTIMAVQQPINIKGVRQFVGLASYYRRYVKNFAAIAAPLHQLLEKASTFQWNSTAEEAFQRLKLILTSAPILANTCFQKELDLFTDASDNGLEAVLEQNGKVIAYASRALRRSERNYSTIEKECLAIIFATKAFRHYLLAKHFTVYTDHSPLQWLSAQKMEGRLCRWALALQEFDFTIKYRKGNSNQNADALSRLLPSDSSHASAAIQITTPFIKDEQLAMAQQADPTITEVIRSFQSRRPPIGNQWRRFPLRRFAQLFPRLQLSNGILFIKQTSEIGEKYVVPVIPLHMRNMLIKSCHEAQTAGHLGIDRALTRLASQAFWIGMRRDVTRFCNECQTCQKCNLPRPTKAPLQNMPIGRPWERLGMDILELPQSSAGNRYALVIQDYFTKWVSALPLKDQTATNIAKHLVNLFCQMGPPEVIHTDQGRNFESDVLTEVWNTFRIRKTRTTPYHPQGDGLVERTNRAILQILRTLAAKDSEWDHLLPAAVLAYNTSKHTSTGFSPYQLIFGRQSFDVNHITRMHENNRYDPPSYYDPLLTRMKRAYITAKRNLYEAAERQCRQYNAHTDACRTFHPGDKVWLYKRNCAKLEPRWEGNWRVLKSLGPVNLKIENNVGRTRVVHANDIRIQQQGENHEDQLQFHHIPTKNEISSPCKDRATQGRPLRIRKPPPWHKDYAII